MIPAKDKLEKMHINLQNPYNSLSFSDSTYVLILACKKLQKTWVLYLQLKNKFVDVFQISLFKVENKSKCSLKTFCTNGEGEFISIKLGVFYKNREIALKYAVLYIYEENGLAEKRWKTIIIIKNLLLLDSRLLLNFLVEAIDIANYL